MEPQLRETVDGRPDGRTGSPPTVRSVSAVPDRAAAMYLPTQEEKPLDLLEATELLRSELGALRLPLALPGVEVGRREKDELIAAVRRLPAAPVAADGCPGARRGRRFDRRGQVDAGQLAGPPGGHP